MLLKIIKRVRSCKPTTGYTWCAAFEVLGLTHTKSAFTVESLTVRVGGHGGVEVTFLPYKFGIKV